MAGDPQLADLADRLLGADTAQQLIAVIEDLVRRLDALPARLYLFDGASQAFYPVAVYGAEDLGPDLPVEAAGGPGCLPLPAHGEIVGLLAHAPQRAGDARLAILGDLLGPLLLRIHRSQGLAEELRETRELITHLTSAGDLLRHLELDVLLTKVLETVIGAVGAQVGAILLPDGAKQLRVQVAWGLTDEHLRHIRVRGGAPVAEAVFADGRPVLASRAEVAAKLDTTGLEAHLDACLALALAARDRILGVVVLGNPEADFDAGKRRLAETLCNLAATAIDNALLVQDAIERERLHQEIALARDVQARMFPTKGLEESGIHIEGASRPCSETGGDYYSFLRRGSDAVAMIGDVSGHGLGAALFTTMAHAIVQQQFRAGASLDTAFRQMNEGLFHTHSGRFMTAAAVAVDLATGSLRYVSAGHNPLLWIHHGEVRWIESLSLPLGIAPELEIDPAPALEFSPGDLLVLYTDGITEAAGADGVCLGEERLADICLAAWRSQLPPDRVIALITAAVESFTRGLAQADDLTAVVVSRRGDGSVGGWQSPPAS